MGQGIKGNPNTYDFGYDFDYSLWAPGTQIDLVNVPWNNDYRDVVKFENASALDTYINSRTPAGIKIEQLSYVKPNEPVRVDIPHNRAQRYNYLRASNPLQPIPGDVQKNYYYFILDTKYIAPNTTELILQLDVWATFIYNVTIGNSYVERGHVGIANEDNFSNYGRDYLTVPEGLDIGGEYIVHEIKTVSSMILTDCDVLVISTVDLRADAGTVANPTLVSAPGAVFQRMASGASAYVWRTQSLFAQWMAANKTKPWVTQGIISITLIPDSQRYHPDYNYDSAGDTLPSLAPAGVAQDWRHDLWDNWREEVEWIPDRYYHLKKLWTYPYMLVEFTTYSGSPIVLKPESWNSVDAEIQEMAGLVPPNQRIAYIPMSYNSLEYDPNNLHAEYLSMAVYFGNFPSLPLVNDGAIGYLAANVNQIGWQKANAEWTQNRALGMAGGAYDIAGSAIQTMRDLTGIGIGSDVAQTANTQRTNAAQAIVDSLGGLAGNTAGGSAFGPPGAALGAITGATGGIARNIGTAIGNAALDEALAIRNAQANQSLGANVNQSQMVRDTNKGLADWAAKGDYANAIGGIDAKVQDAAMIQPSTSGTYGGESFNLINQIANFTAKWKFIDKAALRRVGDYWLRYGYAIHNFMMIPPSLKVMENFTYWKLSETYIIAADVPEGFKQAIRGIFEKGVTVWTDPAKIGTIDIADNQPIEGAYY